MSADVESAPTIAPSRQSESERTAFFTKARSAMRKPRRERTLDHLEGQFSETSTTDLRSLEVRRRVVRGGEHDPAKKCVGKVQSPPAALRTKRKPLPPIIHHVCERIDHQARFGIKRHQGAFRSVRGGVSCLHPRRSEENRCRPRHGRASQGDLLSDRRDFTSGYVSHRTGWGVSRGGGRGLSPGVTLRSKRA